MWKIDKCIHKSKHVYIYIYIDGTVYMGPFEKNRIGGGGRGEQNDGQGMILKTFAPVWEDGIMRYTELC
jgi:hypothetical protein